MAWTLEILAILLIASSIIPSSVHAQSYPEDEESSASAGVKFSLEPSQQGGGFNLVATKDGVRDVLGHIGRGLQLGATTYVNIESQVVVKTGPTTFNFSVHESGDAAFVRVSWYSDATARLEDCFDFGDKHWYGGPEQFYQMWPVQNANLSQSSYVTKEADNGAISERYWLNSAGQYIYVRPESPLFVDYHNLVDNHICLISQVSEPYSSSRTSNLLEYDIWLLADAKRAHLHAVENYLGKPTGVPDRRMIEHPIWSTWAKYSRDIDDSVIREFASQIRENEFEDAQLEIDDLWEVCYGSLTVDERKFPNLTELVRFLKEDGFRVTIWVHPFINKGCEPWYSNALENGYLVLSEDGSPDTSWWNNNGSIGSYVDFTNPAAAEWWAARVRSVLDTYDIDSAKFDAGESSFSPQIPRQTGDVDLHPSHIVSEYVRTCAQFGSQIEVRSGFRTQQLPIFVRMVDRDSVWGIDNGLQTVITTTLQMNLNGYTLVLPDMIGGNGMNLHANVLPDKQLFIRWLQANTFLPAMQYSFVPWDFDNETISIARKYTELHAQYADAILAAMNESVHAGTPVNPPVWWIDPADQDALGIWDQYLLGESILVAPILEENATSRDIYLPKGVWLEQGREDKVHEGPVWLRDYAAPLDTLPYFIAETRASAAVGVRALASVVVAAVVVGMLY